MDVIDRDVEKKSDKGRIGDFRFESSCRVQDQINALFSFLDNGEYAAVLFKDGVNADEQAFDYKKEVMKIKAQSKLTVRMASGGGFAISLRKI